MKENEKNHGRWYSFEEMDKVPWLVNGFTTRQGGVSEGIFATMNISFTRGDDPAKVKRNMELCAERMGFEPAGLVFGHQTHTINVACVEKEDRGRGYDKPQGWTDVDGLITNTPGVTLATLHADCVPLYFVDPVHKAIGLSHSGWRGTADGMATVTIQAMQDVFGSRPEEMLAAIGPCICRDCYEVGEDVAQYFEEDCKTPLGPKESCFCGCGEGISPTRESKNEEAQQKYLLDLVKANRKLITAAGIPQSNLFESGLCTCCHPDVFFSHRYHGEQRGLNTAFLGIRQAPHA